ncbi:MAG: hypothetical protein ACI9X4_001436 [Glaciecola sp.]
MDLTDFDELGRDFLGEEQRDAIVKFDAFFPGFHGVDLEHRVLGGGTAAGLHGVFFVQSQVDEAAARGTQAAFFSTRSIATADAHVQEFGRLHGIARLHGEGVSVQSTDAIVFDFVTLTVSAIEGCNHIVFFDGLAQTLVERADDFFHLAPASLVQVQVKFLGLMPQHVSQGAGDSFGQSSVHGERIAETAGEWVEPLAISFGISRAYRSCEEPVGA